MDAVSQQLHLVAYVRGVCSMRTEAPSNHIRQLGPDGRCLRCGGTGYWETEHPYKELLWVWNCYLCGASEEFPVRRPGENGMLIVDQNEPMEMSRLINQSVETQRLPLNHGGFADYMWQTSDGHMTQIERKQWTEVLSDIDAVESQLRRELKASDELALLVEGVMVPTPYGAEVYRQAGDRPLLMRAFSYGTPERPQVNLHARVLAWLWQLDKSGITVYHTPCLAGTATALVTYYKQSQKEEHTVLQRYIKPRVTLKDHNPQINTLMGIVGADLGEQRATMLIGEFGDVYTVLNANKADLERLPGIGPGVVKKLFKAVGREE